MKRSVVLATSLTVLLILGLAVQARSPKDDWLPGDKLKECLDLAGTKNVPVAILVQIQFTTCPIHNSRVSTCETLADLKGMLKVRVYAGERAPGYSELDCAGVTGSLPMVLLTDGENHLLGYVAEETKLMDVRETAQQAASIMAWKATAKAALASAEKQIEAKQLVPARKQVDLVIKQDLAATKTVKMSVSKTARDAVAIAAEISTSADRAKKVDEPVVTEGLFFDAKTKELLTKLDALLAEKLAEAETLLGQGDLKKASQALAPLLQYKFGESSDAQIKALNEKIKTATKEAAKAKLEAPKAAAAGSGATKPTATQATE